MIWNKVTKTYLVLVLLNLLLFSQSPSHHMQETLEYYEKKGG